MPLRSSRDESPQSSSQPSSSEPSSQLRGQLRQKRDKRGRGDRRSKRLQRPDLSRATIGRDPKRQSSLQDPRLGSGRYPGDGRDRSSTPARRREQGDLEEQPRDHLRRAGNVEGGEPVAEKFGRAKKRGETPPRRGEKIFEQLEEEPLSQEYTARMLGRGEEVVGRVKKELARIQEVSVDTHREQRGWQQLVEAADRGEKDDLAEGAVEGDSRGGGNEEKGELERRQIDDRDGEILEISLPLRS